MPDPTTPAPHQPRRPAGAQCWRVPAPLVWLLLALTLFAAAGAAQSQPVALPAGVERGPSVEGMTEYRLANGLRVLTLPDATAPTFLFNITYLVGSRHEGYGERGMAHLIEHLLFRASRNHPNIAKELSERGAAANGTTWHDRTNYFATFAATDDNLRWVVAMEADRMVNAEITREQLDPEMTVVRNEFEAGENNPIRVLIQRVASAAYLWHNYGNDTIGNRSDIENMPIERLYAFYRAHYRPDNAVVLIAGRFDEALALELVARHFGAIARPQQPVPQTYTVEPPQEGERSVVLRRVGDTQAVVAAYHIPPASHPDMAPLDLLTEILRAAPAGRLHRALVEPKLAASVFGFEQQLRDPGLAFYGAVLRTDQSLERAREALVATVEGIATAPITDEEVERARAVLLRGFDQTLSSPPALGRVMSEWIAVGDWRLFFLHRDRLRKATAADVQRVAQTYFRPYNRTLGAFIPSKQPARVEIPPAPDLAALLEGYTGDVAVAAGEAFEATPAEIERRTLRARLPVGLQLEMLPRKTRGATVVAQLTLRFGDERNLFGRNAEAGFAGALLAHGTSRMSRQQIQDEFNRLRAQVSFSGGSTSATVSLRTVREHLPAALGLVAQVLRDAAFPEPELEQVRAQWLAALDQQRQDPQALSQNEFNRLFNIHPRGDVRHVQSLDEDAEDTRRVTADEVRRFHREFYGASHGQLALVGDFDPQAIEALAATLFDGWPSRSAYARVPARHAAIAPVRRVIETPDRANAYFLAGMNLDLRTDDPDFPALLLGDYLLGGGFISSRLGMRIRQKDGLSYSVWSRLAASHLDRSGSFMVRAIHAPENAARLERAFREELERALRDGFSDEEVASARTGFLQAAQVARASDARLAAALVNNAFLGRTYEWQQQLERRIAALTAEQIVGALRRHIDPARMVVVLAGDFRGAARKAAGAAGGTEGAGLQPAAGGAR